jgi:hypothetical protein
MKIIFPCSLARVLVNESLGNIDDKDAPVVRVGRRLRLAPDRLDREPEGDPHVE